MANKQVSYEIALQKEGILQTWELMRRIVVLEPTSFSKPAVGAALNRTTASWASVKNKQGRETSEDAEGYISLRRMGN